MVECDHQEALNALTDRLAERFGGEVLLSP